MPTLSGGSLQSPHRSPSFCKIPGAIHPKGKGCLTMALNIEKGGISRMNLALASVWAVSQSPCLVSRLRNALSRFASRASSTPKPVASTIEFGVTHGRFNNVTTENRIEPLPYRSELTAAESYSAEQNKSSGQPMQPSSLLHARSVTAAQNEGSLSVFISRA